MATKMATGTAVGTWTLATRKIVVATTAWTGGAPASADISKPLVWIATGSAAAYTMEIESIATVLTNTEIVVKNKGTLPANVTMIAIGMADLVTTHTYQSYLDEMAGNIQDDAAKLSATELDQALASAVTKFGEDEPWVVAKRVQGTAAKTYNLVTSLPGLWKLGDSSVVSIEYPDGNDPPEILPNDEWGIYDDGTAQDGSNLVLRFLNYEPTASEYFVVRMRIENALSVASQNFPDTQYNHRAICLLASSYACRRLAAAYAQSTDSTITADSVQYHEKTDKYLRLAVYYQEEYNRMVFGAKDQTSTVKAATTERTLETLASDRQDYLFHPRG